jgi:iron complex transport system permease protein
MKLNKLPPAVIYSSLAGLLFILVILSAKAGAVYLTLEQVLEFTGNLFSGNKSPTPVYENLFLYVRMPRVFMCIIVGAVLSAGGTVMQSIFRNPIVEPGIIGTSAGAALGAAFMFVFGQMVFFSKADFLGSFMLPAVAFAGGMTATFLVYRFSNTFGKVNVTSMILAGMAVNALAAGGTGFLSYMARDPQARSITFWNLGTFSAADWASVTLVFCVSLICLIYIFGFSKDLNAMQLGDEEASYLGINVERVKLKLIIATTLMVSVATSMVGVISFVGLIVPHILRLLRGSDNRYLTIGSMLLGANVMLGADIISRVIIAPAEMPIGIITAFVGAPLFLWLLGRMKKQNVKGGVYA